MRLIYCVLWLLILLVGIGFGILNSQQVSVDYYTHSARIFLPLLLVVAMAIGAVLAWLVVSPSMLRQRRQCRRLQKQLNQAERQLEDVEHLKGSESYPYHEEGSMRP